MIPIHELPVNTRSMNWQEIHINQVQHTPVEVIEVIEHTIIMEHFLDALQMSLPIRVALCLAEIKEQMNHDDVLEPV